MKTEKTTFERLVSLDVNSKVEMKQRQKYLSWTYAWAELKKACPDASYVVHENENGLQYFESSLGFMVKTSVTANGETHSMWLPVMDGANNAMKAERYSYQVKEYVNRQPTGKMIEKWVEAATMFDINKAIMRCLVKNIAMFGLGLYIFSGEDMPEAELIDASQITQITKLATEVGADLMKFNQFFGISRVSELHAVNFDRAIDMLNKKKKESE
jgi:hypothetical protein